ncbi:MAG: NAD(P)-dependent oxidoreductase [Terrimicrobiaceae bacterium]
MNLLLTGAAGFLGQGLISQLEMHHALRLMDVVSFPTQHPLVIGDVSDLDTARKAVDGVDALIIAHMAPNRPEIYGEPTIPFDVNVKGAANLFAAAQEGGVRRVVLISSTSVVGSAMQGEAFVTEETRAEPLSMYALTKACQETIARHYFARHKLPVAILRPACVVDADTVKDKYGQSLKTENWELIDRRDIGKAAHLALMLPGLQCEIFHVIGHPAAEGRVDVLRTRERLGWKPDYPFQGAASREMFGNSPRLAGKCQVS